MNLFLFVMGIIILILGFETANRGEFYVGKIVLTGFSATIASSSVILSSIILLISSFIDAQGQNLGVIISSIAAMLGIVIGLLSKNVLKDK